VIDNFAPEQLAAGTVTEPALTVWLGNPEPANPLTIGFEQLPQRSRIDATTTSEPVERFLKHLLQSALG
jgi:hypothetical protein